MDNLFGDLPAPSAASPVVGQSLFDDLPPADGGPGLAGGKEDRELATTETEPTVKGQSPNTTTTTTSGRLHAPVKRKADNGEELQNSVKQQKLAAVFELKGYVGERRGEREDMQDAHVIIDDFTSSFPVLPHGVCHSAYYGVFDGHGGPKAAKFAAEHLHKVIVDKFPKGEVQNIAREVKKCLVDSFKNTDEDFLHRASMATPSWKDGSTAVCLLAMDDVVYSANVGDSRAVLCRRKGGGGGGGGGGEEAKEGGGSLTCVSLTKDHNPSNFEERKRIEKAGGSVREGRVMGIVEVSRSIGDGRLKRCGVISTPDVLRCQLTENDLFIIVACDGLWKVFSSEDAAKFVLQVLTDKSIQLPKEGNFTETNFESTRPLNLRDVRYDAACNRLAVEAVKRGCTDNVTIMLINIGFTEDLCSCSSNDCHIHTCDTTMLTT